MINSENPYALFIETLRGDMSERQSPGMVLGQVLEVSPLKVEVLDTVQDSDSLFVNSELLLSAGNRVLLAALNEDKLCVICKVDYNE